MKQCPFCAEEIQDAAIVCKHCGRDLKTGAAAPSTADVAKKEAEKKAAGCAGVGCLSVIVLIVILFVVSQFNSSSTPNTGVNGSGSSSSFLDLKARVSFTGTQFVITNNDLSDWTDVKLEINGGIFSGGYELKTPRIAAGSTATVGAMQFAKSDGTRFNPLQMKPQKFVVVAKMDGEDGIYAGGWQ